MFYEVNVINYFVVFADDEVLQQAITGIANFGSDSDSDDGDDIFEGIMPLPGTKPYITHLLGTKPYIALVLGTKPYITLLLGTEPYITLLLGTKPYIIPMGADLQ